MPSHYDVIIIGTRPGGGTLARKLALSGKKILLLERAGYLLCDPGKDNWNSRTVFIKNRYKTKEIWKDKNGNRYHLGIHNNVGGTLNMGTEQEHPDSLPGARVHVSP